MMRRCCTVSKTASAWPVVSLLLRMYACGVGLHAGNKCGTCGRNNGMSAQGGLTVGLPGDAYEHDADRIADRVTSAPGRAVADLAPPRMQRFAGQAGGHDDAVPASVERTLATRARRWNPRCARTWSSFQHDFSRVRVDADAQAAESARAVNALAFTVGNHLVFAPEQYSLDTTQGHRLIAHELTHVIQQTQGTCSRALQRQPSPRRAGAVDANARLIIDLAQDTSRPIDVSEIAVVRAIIDQYYRAGAALASQYALHAVRAGTARVPHGADAVGRAVAGRTVRQARRG
jgi:hypothetical protein